MTTIFTIKANTPKETKTLIVKWLRDQAINHSVGSRIAEHKKVQAEHKAKSAAYTSAADFIELINIEPIPKAFGICTVCGHIHDLKLSCPPKL